MKLSGYDDAWYTDDGLGAKTFADASPISVGAGQAEDLGELQVGAIPAVVAGSVGGDAGGATIKLVRPGVVDPDTPALVAEVVQPRKHAHQAAVKRRQTHLLPVRVHRLVAEVKIVGESIICYAIRLDTITQPFVLSTPGFVLTPALYLKHLLV